MFKKLRVKFLARSMLVAAIVVSACSFLCAAASVVTVSFTNPKNLPYGADSLVYEYFGADGSSVQGSLMLGGSTSLTRSISYEQDYLTVFDGDIIADDEMIDGLEVNVPDGEYVQFLILYASVTDGASIGLNDDQADSVVYGSGGIEVEMCFYSSIPDEINVELVETESALRRGVLVLVPRPQEPSTMFNVWSGVLRWITLALNSVSGVFWYGGKLTLVGLLGLCGTAIAFCLLVFNKCRDFLCLQ